MAITFLSRGILPRTFLSTRFGLGRGQSRCASNVPTLPSFTMQGKVCMVTGAAGGLGYEFCKAFLKSGCTSLAIVDLNVVEAKKAAEKLTARYQSQTETLRIVGLACDVSSQQSVRGAVAEVMTNFGQLDAVVASAGMCENYAALDYPPDRFERMLAVNVHGAFYTACESARVMIPHGGGAITLVGSMSSSVVNVPQVQTPYNASKAAVKHMAASLGVEWAKDGVRVNTLSPGYMLTNLTKDVLALDPELKKTWQNLTPMGTMGEPEDLAGAVVFLSSDASRFMTSAEIRVDGGYCVT